MTKHKKARGVREQSQLLHNDDAEARSDSGGQSGDTQGLSQNTDAADESVKELVESDQTYEADVEIGIDDAADHPERPVPIRGDSGL